MKINVAAPHVSTMCQKSQLVPLAGVLLFENKEFKFWIEPITTTAEWDGLSDLSVKSNTVL